MAYLSGLVILALELPAASSLIILSMAPDREKTLGLFL